MQLHCGFFFKRGNNPGRNVDNYKNDESDLRKSSKGSNLHWAGGSGRGREWSNCLEGWNAGYWKDYRVSFKLEARTRISAA
jgi:hypothetical protein